MRVRQKVSNETTSLFRTNNQKSKNHYQKFVVKLDTFEYGGVL